MSKTSKMIRIRFHSGPKHMEVSTSQAPKAKSNFITKDSANSNFLSDFKLKHNLDRVYVAQNRKC